VKLSRDLMVEIAKTTLSKKGVIVLTRTLEESDEWNLRFRQFVMDLYPERKGTETRVPESHVLKPAKSGYSKLHSGGWALFHPVEDLGPDDHVGSPDYVYWPTQGMDYERLPYLTWQEERRKSVWRPILVKGELDKPKKPGAPLTAWDILLKDD
jgi:hypothetical protein